MKEVRCIALDQDDYRSPYKMIPYRVLVPEMEHTNDPDVNADNVLNHCSNGYYSTVVTKMEGDLAERFWSIVDWDNAEIVDPTPENSEEAIDLWRCLGQSSKRCRELEPLITQEDHLAERYCKEFPKSDWVGWEDEDLARSPIFLFMYAQQVMKGRLPEHLHAAMIMHSYRSPENKYVKRYCKGRRYKYHCKKNLRPEVRFMQGA